MKFPVAAAFVAAATFFGGAFAEDQQTSMSTLTVTRTVQRVVQTVTSTRCSSGFATSTPTGTGYINGTVVSPSLSASAPVQATGAASAMNIEMIGMAAAAGLVGFFAL